MLTCEGTAIPTQDEMELLGVTLDNKLKFDSLRADEIKIRV